ncbi:ESPR-type extended signal peptide-containing protein [Stenotrophomonas geniculata]|uniref:ESPR-type extended signal peptide-containing protein n=1 Tax=Stenotrophomonas geniculata TaxID=86188 RepID=UPI00234F24E5|nr:ESPR-type extended signal peptide-containing protein [Stenotrophomonas geniculata]MDC7801466.1 ESPR-type extended signal peptide-containing protein [Stenotrophomonas geniculata]
MNRIYRRLWSRVRQCWVVASELAPSRGKASSTVRAGGLVLLSLLVVPTAGAREDDEDDTAWWARQTMSAFVATAGASGREFETRAVNRGDVYSNTSRANWSVIDGKESMALGSEARASGEHSLAAGISSRAAGARSVTLGSLSEAWGDNSIALGHYAVTENGGYGTAVGTYSRANGIGATALGQNAKAQTENSIAVGSGSMTNAGAGISKIAIGGDAYAGSSGWTGAIALGGESRAEYDGVAVGYGAKTSANGTVALGRGSLATEANTVSVGSASVKRRVVNVADAGLNSTSSDAVTGKQLYATNSNVTKAQAAADGAKTTATAAQSTANTANSNANSALAKANAVSGLVSQVSAAGNVRLGGENTGTVLDVRNKSNAVRSITGLKDGALSTSSTEAVTGRQLNATNSNVTAVRTAADAAKTTATAAQTTATTANTNANTALAKANTVSGLVSQVSASGNVRLGGENTGTVLDARNKSNAVRSITGLKDGALSTSSTEAVTGKQLNATNSNVAAVKSTADAAQARVAVLDGLVGQVSASGNLRLGADNAGTVVDVANKSGAKRKLQNLANGVLSASSTDAVTGQQLNATNSEVTSVRTAATAAKTAADAARGVADGAVQKADALGGLVGQVSASGNVRLGAENTGTIVDVANKSGGKRRIYNIANGTLSTGSTDAVTGQQLFATNATVETQRQDLAGHAQQLTDQDGRIADNRVELDALRADFDNFDPDLDGVVKFSADRRLVDMEGARVSGVAAGDISSSASTDAVNGGQLFATNLRMAEMEDLTRFIAVGADGFSTAALAGDLGVALGDGAIASVDKEGATALGAFSTASAKNSVALGRAANVHSGAEDGFALGGRSQVAAKYGVSLGAESEVHASAIGSVALGYQSIARESETVSIGNDSLQRRLVNVARGRGSNDAATAGQMNEALATLGGGAGLDGAGSIIAPEYKVQGSTQSTVCEALVALDGAVVKASSRSERVESQMRATFQQSPSIRADGIGQLNLAGPQGMVLSNLADGRIAAGSRDAVTGSQLYAAKQDIARNRSGLDALRDAENSGIAVAASAGGVIDFGGATLTGVADGMLLPEGKDVVNGGQLYATNSRVESLEERTEMLAVGSELHRERAEAGIYGLALGNGAQASMDSEGGTAVGSYTSALGKNSVALGRGAYVSSFAENGYALGAGARVDQSGGVALGSYAIVTEDALESVALGAYSYASERGVVSFGNDSLKRRLTNVAHGVAQHDAATIGQLRGALSTLGGNIDANGNVTTSGFTVQGQHQSTVNDALTTLDAAVVTTGSRMDRVETQLRSVFQEAPSTRGDGTAQLTLAGANGMVISNVANGLIAAGSREAVNGGQLHAVQQQLNGRMDGLEQRVDGQPQSRALSTASAAPTEQVTPTPEASDSPQVASAGEGTSPTPQPKSKKDDTPSPTPQVDTAELEKMLARANEYTDGAISNFERRLDKMDKRFNRMAAMSSAQTAMAMNTAGLATYNRLGAGVGYAEGESAMAVGYQRVLNEKGSATFSLNGAFTNSGERSMGVGVGIGW